MLIPYEKLNQPQGDNPLDVIEVVKSARTAYCSLSGAIRDNLGISELPLLGRGLLGDLYRLACPENDDPNRSIPPSNQAGGQCQGQLYTVTFKLQEYYSPDNLDTRETQLYGLNVVGKVYSVTLRNAGQYEATNVDKFGAGFGAASILCHGDQPGQPTASPVWVDVTTSVDFRWVSMTGISVLPQPGQSDSCGLAPVKNPPPVRIPDSIPVNFPDGVRNLPWKIPSVNFDPDISFEPKLVIQVEDLNIIFDFSGANVNFNLSGSVNIPIGTGSQGSEPGEPKVPDALNDSIYNLNSRLKALKKQIEELSDCVCPPLETLQTNPIGNGRGGTFLLSPARNRYCAVAITSKPSNRKEQIAVGGSNVLYAGWAWFGSQQGYKGLRLPIDCEGKIFENTGHYDQFTYFLYDGYQADIFELNVPIPPPEE